METERAWQGLGYREASPLDRNKLEEYVAGHEEGSLFRAVQYEEPVYLWPEPTPSLREGE